MHMIRKTFRLLVRLGLLAGLGVALFKFVQGRRSADYGRPSTDWAPAPAPAVNPNLPRTPPDPPLVQPAMLEEIIEKKKSMVEEPAPVGEPAPVARKAAAKKAPAAAAPEPAAAPVKKAATKKASAKKAAAPVAKTPAEASAAAPVKKVTPKKAAAKKAPATKDAPAKKAPKPATE